MVKKFIAVSILLCIVVSAVACGLKSQTVNIDLYYANEDNSKILVETREIKTSKNNPLPKVAIEELLKGPKADGLKSNIPTETKLLSVEVKDKIATVNFSKEFSHFPGTMAEGFALISVVNTLTNLPGMDIEKVNILVEGKELIAPSGNPYGPLSKYDIDQINKDLNTETITLYFFDKEAMYMMPETRQVLKTEPIELTIVKELMAGPTTDELTRPAIPEEARLISVEIKGDTAYVNFSKELKEKHIGGSTGEITTIYPIINSLTELPGVDKVQFLIEGEKEKTLAGHLIFDEPFSRDESLIRK